VNLVLCCWFVIVAIAWAVWLDEALGQVPFAVLKVRVNAS